MTPTLLPCPFCGGEATCYHHDEEENGWVHQDWVSCKDEDCGAQTSLHATSYDAIAAWNRRPETPASGTEHNLATAIQLLKDLLEKKVLPLGVERRKRAARQFIAVMEGRPASGEREGKQKRAERDQAMREESLTYIGPPPAPAGSDSGLVERLREQAEATRRTVKYFDEGGAQDKAEIANLVAADLDKAGDRIEQQAAEIRRLKEALVLSERQTAEQTMKAFDAKARAEQAERERDGLQKRFDTLSEAYKRERNRPIELTTGDTSVDALSASEARVRALEAALLKVTCNQAATPADWHEARAALKGE